MIELILDFRNLKMMSRLLLSLTKSTLAFFALTISLAIFAQSSSTPIVESLAPAGGSLPLKMGLKYSSDLDTNSNSAQKSEGFKLQKNTSTYGAFVGYKFTGQDSLTLTHKLSSTIEKDKDNSGQVKSNSIELKYKRKTIIPKELFNTDLTGELKHEYYSNNERRIREGANGESKFYLTGITDYTKNFNFYSEYRLMVRDRTNGKKGNQRHEQRLILSPQYLLNESISFGPGFYYSYVDEIKTNKNSLNLRPQMAYMTSNLEIILSSKFSKIVTNNTNEKLTYNRRAFRTPSIEFELTWNFI